MKLIQAVCWERKLCIDKVELGFEKNYIWRYTKLIGVNYLKDFKF